MCKRAIATASLALLTLTGTCLGQETLAKLVQTALKEERAEFGAIEERFEKGKLKAGERAALFGKKKLTKDQERERIKEVGEQVERGEVSFRILSLTDELKRGQVGVISPKFDLYCSEPDSDSGFFGRFETGQADLRGRPTKSREFYFASIPGTETVVRGHHFKVTVPVIVTGREGDSLRFESFAAIVKNIRSTESKKKKG